MVCMGSIWISILGGLLPAEEAVRFARIGVAMAGGNCGSAAAALRGLNAKRTVRSERKRGIIKFV